MVARRYEGNAAKHGFRGRGRRGRMAEWVDKVDRAVEAREWRAVVALTEAAGTAGNAARVAQESFEQTKRAAQHAERRLRERVRREAAGWAAGVLADPNAVVMGLAVAGFGGRVEALEVALLDTGGKTPLHERVRAHRVPAGSENVAPDEDPSAPRRHAEERGAQDSEGSAARSLGEQQNLAGCAAPLAPMTRE